MRLKFRANQSFHLRSEPRRVSGRVCKPPEASRPCGSRSLEPNLKLGFALGLNCPAYCFAGQLSRGLIHLPHQSKIRIAPGPFFIALFAFVVQSSASRARGGFGCHARLGGLERCQYQLSQFVAAGLDILRLVAILLGGDDHFVLIGQITLGILLETHPGSTGKRADLSPPAQGSFAVDFIDILAARTATAQRTIPAGLRESQCLG